MIDKFIIYESATIEHLKAIAIECHSFGYISEMPTAARKSPSAMTFSAIFSGAYFKLPVPK